MSVWLLSVVVVVVVGVVLGKLRPDIPRPYHMISRDPHHIRPPFFLLLTPE